MDRAPAVVLKRLEKRFRAGGRHRRPLYRDLLHSFGVGGRPDDVAALAAIDLELPRGSSVALIGPNGAGKTTLLRCLAGIYRPSAGEVHVDGRVACYFEAGAGVAPTLPVEDNVLVYAAILGLTRSETESVMDRILDIAELREHRCAAVEHLSYGTQQRLFFAVMTQTMALRKASLFLFDEWLAGTDIYFKDKGEKVLNALRSDDLTMIYASHDLGRLERMCELAIYMKAGRLQGVGPCRDVIERYRAECGRD